MKKFYTTLCLLFVAMAVSAQVEPKVKPEVLVDGHQYVLVNLAQNAEQYMSRTSWDGALYFLGKDASNYANHSFTAVKNDDGTWSFNYPGTKIVETGEYDDEGKPITEEVDAMYYMVLPNGSPNVNFLADIKGTWYPDLKENNFYQLVLKEGHNPSAISVSSYTPTGDLRMHLNNRGDFFVVSYLAGPYYPDCYRGITRTYDEATGDEYFEATDSISFYWGFVSVENIPAYMSDLQAVKALNDYSEEYLGEGYEDYAEGFQASYDAALAIYNSPEYNFEEDPAIIAGILNKKVNLYKDIEDALLIDEPTPALTNAINQAISSFKTAVSESEVEAAITALKNAVAAFKEGTGDLTSMGNNMSFEDLSSQGGSETSSVADVPTGWNMYINGTQVYTASDIRNAGITAWCGINNDSDGEIKDGNESFGIWTSGVPTFELSQTIEGLENGTYIINAGLMAGANGNGTRLTTQRIFGNLNSTYYGEEVMYDPEVLDQSEVYAFAENAEVQTDRTMFPVTVRAYVYDGTLTFGVRTDGNIAATYRTSGNGAGGDGWFKVDNFTIIKEGYNGEDAAAVANHFINAISSYLDGSTVFEKSLQDEIESVLGDNTEVTAETPAETINNIIVTFKDKVPVIKSSVEAYERLWNAIEKASDTYEEYSYAPSAETVLGGAIDDANEAYDTQSANEEQIEALIATLEAAIAQVKSEGVQEGEYANVITNGSFEDQSSQGNHNSDGVENPPTGWNLVFNGVECATKSEYGAAGANVGWCAINSGDNINTVDLEGVEWTHQYTDGEHLWGIWGGNIPEIELYQVIKGLPAGTYVLSCDMIVEWNWGGQCLTTQRIFANKYVRMFGSEDLYADHLLDTEDMVVAQKCDEEFPEAEFAHMTYQGHIQTQSYNETSCPRHMELTFGLVEGEDLKIGFRTNNMEVIDGEAVSHAYDSAGWFKLDNFQLYYDSATVPEGAEATSIGTIENNGTKLAGREYYSLSGAKVSQPQKGITIVKNILSDGSVKTSKVYMK